MCVCVYVCMCVCVCLCVYVCMCLSQIFLSRKLACMRVFACASSAASLQTAHGPNRTPTRPALTSSVSSPIGSAYTTPLSPSSTLSTASHSSSTVRTNSTQEVGGEEGEKIAPRVLSFWSRLTDALTSDSVTPTTTTDTTKLP